MLVHHEEVVGVARRAHAGEDLRVVACREAGVVGVELLAEARGVGEDGGLVLRGLLGAGITWHNDLGLDGGSKVRIANDDASAFLEGVDALDDRRRENIAIGEDDHLVGIQPFREERLFEDHPRLELGMEEGQIGLVLAVSVAAPPREHLGSEAVEVGDVGGTVGDLEERRAESRQEIVVQSAELGLEVGLSVFVCMGPVRRHER